MSTPSRHAVFSLYRKLLRLHRRLPTDMQLLGEQFIRDEFKNHKTASPDHANEFIKEWMVRIMSVHVKLKGDSQLKMHDNEALNRWLLYIGMKILKEIDDNEVARGIVHKFMPEAKSWVRSLLLTGNIKNSTVV